MKYISNSPSNLEKIAQEFIKNISANSDKATVVGLYGDLGAGKTTFSQFVAKSLGVIENITSPTFVIQKIYPIRNNDRKRSISNKASKFQYLIHIDAYRLEKSEELLHLGWREIIADPKNLILIEWPEKVADIMPEHIRVKLGHISENERGIEVSEGVI